MAAQLHHRHHGRGSRLAGAVLTAVLGLSSAAAGVALATPAEAVTVRTVTPRAAADDTAMWSATLDGRDVERSSGDAPVPLRPAAGARLEVTVTNTGTAPLQVRAVRLEGSVMGLTFFAFTTQLDLTVPAGAQARRAIQLDLTDLAGQGVGLIPTRLALLGADRAEISSRSMVADVRGSIISAYGVFGLAVAGVTLLLLIGLALDIARLQLPPNRWRRAIRFLPAGAGVGLTLTFTLSATRLLAPSPTLWVPLVLGCTVAAFLIGYLTPGPPDDDRAGDRRLVDTY